MWFLILQILFLMTLAAVLGAALMYWWLRTRYEDVTHAFKSQTLGSGKGASAVGGLTLPQLRSELEDFQKKMPAPAAAADTNFAPVLQRLTSFESKLSGKDTDLTPINERLEQIESMLGSGAFGSEQTDLNPVLERLQVMDAKLANTTPATTDLPQTFMADYQQRMTALNTGLDDLRNRVAQLGQHVTANRGLPEDYIKDYQTRMGGLQSVLGAMQVKLDSVENAVASPGEQTDLSAQVTQLNNTMTDLGADVRAGNTLSDTILNEHRDSLASMKAALSEINTDVDLMPLSKRIDETRSLMAGMRPELEAINALKPMENTLNDMKEIVFGMRDIDMASLQKSMRSVDSRMDLIGIENRLTSIEYGLAATHHMMRTREALDTSYEAPQREPYRSGPGENASVKSLTRGDRPDESLDPIDIIRHPDERADLLLEAGFGNPDDLKQIHGVGPVLHGLLNDIGVFYFWQIAGWSDEDVTYMDSKLKNYRGEIERNNWRTQAKTLAESPQAAKRPQALNEI